MSSITVPFLSDMGISEQTISETVDISPQVLRDATDSISPVTRGDAIQDSEKLLLQSYTDYAARRFDAVGKNMMATIEALIQDYALAGDVVIRNAARASLDAGTAADTLTDQTFFEASTMLQSLECPQVVDKDGIAVPNGFVATMHPDAYFDVLNGGNVISIAEYQNQNIWLNGELGSLNGFRIVSSPFAKVFGAAGADNGTAVATTLSSAANALSKTISVASASNMSSGRWLTIGTEETGSDLHPENERVRYVSTSGTDITIVGGGSNGGLKYDHASGTAVRNADSVYPVLFGGPMSIAKAYAKEVGEYGEVVGPLKDGLLEQFVSLGWKWYGAFGIINDNWLVRAEVSSTLDA